LLYLLIKGGFFMYGPNHHGWIEIVVGPMYSGKSEELIRRMRRA